MSQVRCGRAALLSGGDSLPSTNLVVDFNQNEGMDGIVFSPTYKMLLRVLKLPLQPEILLQVVLE